MFFNSISVTALIQKYKKAIDGLQDSKEAFDGLTAKRSNEEINLWTKQANRADQKRANGLDAMDIYETKDQKGI